jgi:putative restriction endonuclease
VSALITEFGPPGRDAHRAALPFFHLDRSVWMPEGDALAPRHSVLRDRRALGRFVPEVEEALRRDPALLVEVARRLLAANFPDSYATPICEAVGLDVESAAATPNTEATAPGRRPRGSEFRPRVLRAYDHACAFCGYDGMLCGASTVLSPVALAAAHVQWHALDGPDDVSNGLALCDLHHTLFDRGLLGIDAGRRIVVSPAFSGRSEAAQRIVRDLDQRPLREPSAPRERVADAYLGWHREQVYRADSAA